MSTATRPQAGDHPGGHPEPSGDPGGHESRSADGAITVTPTADHLHDHDHDHDHEHAHVHTRFRVHLINLIGVVTPFLGLIAAVFLLWGVAFNWLYLAIMAVMYMISGFGITIGYHRLFTHRSFKTPKPVAAALAIFGSMAMEGPLFRWVADHRRHHQHSDQHDDPHSPHTHGDGFWGMVKGMWHAHVGWSLVRRDTRDLVRYVHDLRKDKTLRVVNALFPLWVLLSLAIPAAVGGLLTWSWSGALMGFIWGGLVRIFLVHHVTWSINSVCHLWGSRPFKSNDESRNNVIFGVLGLGEGWHNNHHAFPSSARHGLRWWQLDLSYLTIRFMEMIGLATDVRIPTPEKQASRAVKPRGN